jgi:hypothetical protein
MPKVPNFRICMPRGCHDDDCLLFLIAHRMSLNLYGRAGARTFSREPSQDCCHAALKWVFLNLWTGRCRVSIQVAYMESCLSTQSRLAQQRVHAVEQDGLQAVILAAERNGTAASCKLSGRPMEGTVLRSIHSYCSPCILRLEA